MTANDTTDTDLTRGHEWLANSTEQTDSDDPLPEAPIRQAIVVDTIQAITEHVDAATAARVDAAFTDGELVAVRRQVTDEVAAETALAGTELVTEARARAVIHLVDSLTGD